MILAPPLDRANDPATIDAVAALAERDARVRLEWAPEVVEAAFDAGWMLDPNGYLAPVAVMVTATEND